MANTAKQLAIEEDLLTRADVLVKMVGSIKSDISWINNVGHTSPSGKIIMLVPGQEKKVISKLKAKLDLLVEKAKEFKKEGYVFCK